MKWVIRRSVFDSNSSTMHSCVIMTEDQHRRWENENLYYYQKGWFNHFDKLPKDQQPVDGMLYTQEEVLNFLKLSGYEYNPEEELEGYYDEDDDPLDIFIYEVEDDFVSASRWNNSELLERDINYYTTPGGEKIVVECKYGYDG